jgi:hypothetical protein
MNTTTLNMTTLDGGNVIIKKGGGGGSTPPSGGSNWRYFDTTKATVSEGSMPIINMIFSIFKTKYDTHTAIMCGSPTLEEWEAKRVVATAADFNLKIYNPVFANLEGIKTIEELINSLGGVESLKQALGFTEITKEQFYSLD